MIQFTKSDIRNYDIIQDALYKCGLPMSEDQIDVIFENFVTTGELPDYLEEYFNSQNSGMHEEEL